MLYYIDTDIVYKEVPGNTTLAFIITECPNNCPGCHWKELNKTPRNKCTELSVKNIQNEIKKYSELITCVLFFGGEWDINTLNNALHSVKSNELKTCLYTGKEIDFFTDEQLKNIDYIKTGMYVESLGGIESIGSNQKFINVVTGTNETESFKRRF